jgi:hypothetical protein
MDRRKSACGSGEYVGTATPATPTTAAAAPCRADESTMELERPGEERKKRRDAMADDSPDSESADGSFPTIAAPPPSRGGLLPPVFLMTQRAPEEEDDEQSEVEVDLDAGGMTSGAGEPGGRRSREKQPSIVRVKLVTGESDVPLFSRWA